MAKISIIIPCYNQEKYIAECLDSVIAQTYQDWEAIVIDDGSQDGSLVIIQEYAKKNPNKIKVIHQKNQGVVVARNNAIRQATGEYIYPLDGDDTIEPTCLEKLYKHKQNVDVIYSRVQRFGLINEELVLKTPSIWNMSFCNQVVVSALYHKSDWEKYGGYDLNMKDGLEDWEFWLNFVENGRKFYCVPEKLLKYRILQNSRNSTINEKKLRKYIYKKHRKILLARILSVIGHFFFQKKVTKSGKLSIKICKIPVYRRKKMITFNSPTYTANTLEYIKDVFHEMHASGDGKYTKLCRKWFLEKLGCKQALLVHSGTAALELAAILADLQKGDEVIMPSYTFCSTANAFVLAGAIPVFVDIRPDTLNIDETKIEAAITTKTKAIVVVHYAGVACEMDTIMAIAHRHNLLVIEDAAQAFDSYYKGKPLGTIGDMGCFSFHETKNIMSGEGGLFVTNNEKLAERAEIIREKGTNRSRFFRGQVDKYTWVDKGSSYLPSDLIAAYLYSVLEISDKIQKKRKKIWEAYHQAFEKFEKAGKIRLPVIPTECSNNAHMFYILFKDLETRTKFIDFLKGKGVQSVFHYIPLHSAPAGQNYCKTPASMDITNHISDTLARLPLFYDMTEEELHLIIQSVTEFLES